MMPSFCNARLYENAFMTTSLTVSAKSSTVCNPADAEEAVTTGVGFAGTAVKARIRDAGICAQRKGNKNGIIE